MANKLYSFSTNAIHYGYDPESHLGSLTPPVYQTATFTFPSAEAGAARFAGEDSGYFYTRIANPTLNLLETRMAALEHGQASIAFGSGMGAITSTLLALLKSGDEIVVDKTLYGCTFTFIHHALTNFGVIVKVADLADHQAAKAIITSNTCLVYCETPANPNMRLVDLKFLSSLCRRNEARLIVDGTYCTPYIQRPLELGADIVIHSATKYLNGHGDVIAGLAIFADAKVAQQVRLVGLKDITGAVMSPHDANLILRGLKTLEIRMERHCDNAEAVAKFLANRPEVERVYFPGLKDSPCHALAKQQMSRFGAMMAFELKGGLNAGRNFLNALELVQRAVSLGDAESLAQHPASMTHSTYTPEERMAAGISDGLIRLSVGLENISDILEDIQQALQKSHSFSI